MRFSFLEIIQWYDVSNCVYKQSWNNRFDVFEGIHQTQSDEAPARPIKIIGIQLFRSFRLNRILQLEDSIRQKAYEQPES